MKDSQNVNLDKKPIFSTTVGNAETRKETKQETPVQTMTRNTENVN
uniref:Uncharacterized protein n=1 Tax=Rhizophora mucronata TaxID=61149 RepID=A0A2P2MBH8_RHIMU